MEFYFLLIILSVVTSASSKAFIPPDLTEEVPKSLSRDKRDMHDDYRKGYVCLPTYSIYLIGFSMLFMLLAIVILSVALYLALERKSIFGLNFTNKQYVRQESTGVTPLYSASYEEQNKNNGSTLTVNSGIIQISEPRVGDPTTPTRLEESKITFAKRPHKAIVPVMHKGQMDAICKEVLRKVQKSDSASFRDLNDLLKFEKRDDKVGMKSEDVKESEKEESDKNEEKAAFKVESQMFKLKKLELKKDTQKENKTETQKEIKTETQNENKIKDEKIKETKQETKNETTNEPVSEPKPDEIKDVRIEVDKVESDKNEDDSDSATEYDTVPSPIRFRHSGPEPDQAVYDTVPNPIKYRHSGPERDHLAQSIYDTVASPQRVRHSGAETDNDINNLYDLPPTRQSLDGPPRNVIHMDPETEYLMPFSSERTDSCYENAKTKRQSFKSP